MLLQLAYFSWPTADSVTACSQLQKVLRISPFRLALRLFDHGRRDAAETRTCLGASKCRRRSLPRSARSDLHKKFCGCRSRSAKARDVGPTAQHAGGGVFALLLLRCSVCFLVLRLAPYADDGAVLQKAREGQESAGHATGQSASFFSVAPIGCNMGRPLGGCDPSEGPGAESRH